MTRLAAILIVATLVVSGVFGKHKTNLETWLSSKMPLSESFLEKVFGEFTLEYGKKYDPIEKSARYSQFAKNIRKIQKLNAEETGTATYGINEMADWAHEEFLAKRANARPETFFGIETLPVANVTKSQLAQIPVSFDWRSLGKVSPVKDQGICGSCWAFATVSVMETAKAIKYDVLQNMSEQQLLDCDKKSKGCRGGWMEFAFQSIKDKGGLMSDEKYPYEGRQYRCRVKPKKVVAKLAEVMRFADGDTSEMTYWIATSGTCSNAMNSESLQFYKNGIIRNAGCRGRVNHAVVLVGYGTENGQDFWIVRNSWGKKWGEDGYFRIARGVNACSIEQYSWGATIM
ncbi:unnamed protein product [Bemisia tabaci]|uniref:Uncharacterized protein n=1 Tax=Bemisia tabaci TaxID=7038 RepID=A0A9N9ZZV9_BEMTA|nr:unnamed protein product [Bemisia tabaci]